jgi:hypothetical protein
MYHLFVTDKNRGPAARRRLRQQQQKNENRLQYRSVSEIGSDLTKISQPPKAYQIFDVDADSTAYSNNKKTNYPHTKTSSSIKTNTIRLEMIKKSTLDKRSSLLSRSLSTNNKVDSKETDSTFNTNRGNSTITVTRISNTARRHSMSNERKIRQSQSSKVLVTRVKK